MNRIKWRLRHYYVMSKIKVYKQCFLSWLWSELPLPPLPFCTMCGGQKQFSLCFSFSFTFSFSLQKSPCSLIRKLVFHCTEGVGASPLFALCAINRQLQHLKNENRMFLRVLFTLWAIKSNSEGAKSIAVNQPSYVANVAGRERVIRAAVNGAVWIFF